MYDTDWSSDDVLHVYTDASDYGYGGLLGDQWFAMVYASESASLRERSINWRELHAAVKALASWGEALSSRKVIFHIDNSSVCYILTKLYTPVQELLEMVRQWTLVLEANSILSRIVYISTGDNVAADRLSRGQLHEFLADGFSMSGRVWPAKVSYFGTTI